MLKYVAAVDCGTVINPKLAEGQVHGSLIMGIGFALTERLIFDEKGDKPEVISNPFNIGGGGAGIAVAKMLEDRGVNVFIAGTIGKKMADALEERGIQYYEKKDRQECDRECTKAK